MSDSVFDYMTAIRLQPKDIVIFSSPAPLTIETRTPIIKLLNAVFPDHDSVILEGGQDIAVLRPESELRKRPRRRSGGLSNG